MVGIWHADWVGDSARARENPNDGRGYGQCAFNAALRDGGLRREDTAGLIAGPTTAYERLDEVLGLDTRWGDQAEAVLSTAQACMAIETGMAEVVALVYGTHQRTAGTPYCGPQAMWGDAFLSYVDHVPCGLTPQGALYALPFQAWLHARDVAPGDLEHVAVAQRGWSSLNPNAIMRGRVTLED